MPVTVNKVHRDSDLIKKTSVIVAGIKTRKVKLEELKDIGKWHNNETYRQPWNIEDYLT